jgi:cell division protein FtsB
MNFKLNTPLMEAFEELDKINSAGLKESAQTDELTKLDTEIADLEAEIKDLKTKYETASSKYRNELESTEEYKALEAKYNELESEFWGLKWSYRRYDPYDRDGGDWEVDEEQYEKVKDRIAELEQILKEMSDDYWAPSTQAHDRADKEFAYSDKKQKLKANQDKRAQGLANLIAEEAPEATQIVDKLNKDLKEPMFTLNTKEATFKANKLRMPIYTKEFEDEYELDEDDFEDFDGDDSPSSIGFKCERYADYYKEDKLYELEISPEDLAETFGYKETADGYNVMEGSEWILTKDTEMYITEEPEVLELEYGDDGIGHYEYWGQTGYDSRPYVAIESASDTIKYKFIYYLQKNF